MTSFTADFLVAADYVRVKFGDSKSNGFQDIWGADFVSNEHGEVPIIVRIA